ncbi:MAG: TerC/Alx family metal homeostasis membrane protein [Chitinophagales bacterium]|tara:strand:+ start:3825 stop:4820 length:996 start_codon:yes stop_codon:yes gene_type:complete
MESFLSHPLSVILFAVVIIIMLLLDLGVFNRQSHAISNKEAVYWTIAWISLSMLFSGFIFFTQGFDSFTQFQSAYWIEKALSIDNLFVFILVFGFFKVPKKYQHKVLFWGILGALAMRAIFIFSGVGLIKLTYLPNIVILGEPRQINALLTLFGAFLVYAGIQSWFIKDEEDEHEDFSKSAGARFVYRLFKVSKGFDGDKFFTIENGVKVATPLLVVVGVIEFSDLLFAVDSIPAIFAISDDPLILYTSNIFAILGLRSLYFLLANFIHMFSRLNYGLAIILSFIGVKMLINPFFHISSPASLAIVASVLILSVIASLIWPIEEDSAAAKK